MSKQEQEKKPTIETKEQAPPTPPPPTPEELQARAEEITDKFFPVRGRRKIEAKKPEPEPEKKPEVKPEPPPAPEPPKVEEKPKAEPKKREEPVEVPPEPTFPAESPDIEETVNRLMNRQAPAEPPQELKLSPNDREILDVLHWLEKKDPARKGVSGQMVAFWKKEQDYIRAWKKEHPGEKYDTDAPEHEEFYEENEPAITQDDISKAQRAREKDEIVSELRKEFEEKNRAHETRAKVQSKEPEIRYKAHKAIVDFVDLAAPELGKLIAEKNGDRLLDAEVDKAIQEANPVAADLLRTESEKVAAVAAEIERLAEFPETHKLNPNAYVELEDGEAFFPHRIIQKIAEKTETDLARMNPQRTMRDGKRFLTSGKFYGYLDLVDKSRKTPEEKAALKRDFFRTYYTITYDDIRAAAIAHFASRAKEKLQKFSPKQPVLPAGENTDASQQTQAPKGKAPDETPAPVAPKRSPSIASATDTVATDKTEKKNVGLTEEDIERKMWGR